MARTRPMRKRPMRWRHISGTIWGPERHELWRGDSLYATVKPGKTRGSSWWAGGGGGVALKRVAWSALSVAGSKAKAKAYVAEQLDEPGEPTP